MWDSEQQSVEDRVIRAKSVETMWVGNSVRVCRGQAWPQICSRLTRLFGVVVVMTASGLYTRQAQAETRTTYPMVRWFNELGQSVGQGRLMGASAGSRGRPEPYSIHAYCECSEENKKTAYHRYTDVAELQQGKEVIGVARLNSSYAPVSVQECLVSFPMDGHIAPAKKWWGTYSFRGELYPKFGRMTTKGPRPGPTRASGVLFEVKSKRMNPTTALVSDVPVLFQPGCPQPYR